jgi:hypothetical protein
MKRVFALERFVTGVLGLALLLGCFACSVTASAADAPRPLAPSTALSLQEARVIIDAAGEGSLSTGERKGADISAGEEGADYVSACDRQIEV